MGRNAGIRWFGPDLKSSQRGREGGGVLCQSRSLRKIESHVTTFIKGLGPCWKIKVADACQTKFDMEMVH